MHSHLRVAVALTAVLSVLLLPVSAGAAVDEYALQASTTSVRLAVFEDAVGDPVLELATTDAFAASDPIASASVDPITVLGQTPVSLVEAESTGDAVRDPEEGDGCAIPVSVDGLALDAICAVAAADAGGPGEFSAAATTDLLQVGVNGSLVGTLLSDPLGDTLNDLTDELADGAAADAIEQFEEACNENLQGVSEGAMVVNDLVGMLPEQADTVTQPVQDILDDVDEDGACSAIIDLTIEDVVAPVIDVQPIVEALDGQNLLTLSVDGAVSDVQGGDSDATASAEQAFARITGPSLDFLDDTIVGLLEGIEGGLVDSIEEITGQELPEDLDISDEVQGILDMVPLFGIDEPLLEATVSGGAATASLARDDASSTPGGEQPFVTISIAGGVLELFGQDPEMGTMTFEAGQSQTIAEGTPLESTISVGALTTDEDATFGEDELPGSTATASATTVNLFNTDEAMGGIELVLAESSAGAFGTQAASPDSPGTPDDPDLPQTGGGAALFAVLALGGGLLLLRRRD